MTTKATLKINGEKEFTIEDELITLGRASDNKISLADDSNVSRYHAEIENRSGEFWLIELGSSNGTTVNGAPVETEIPLQSGDVILLGGSG
jgi:pSer/pThr/pTyr-binding forkhead associated (FHA) protein